MSKVSNMSVSDIFAQIRFLSLDDLVHLNQMIVQRIKQKRNLESQTLLLSLSYGSRVRLKEGKGKLYTGAKGVVKKIKRKNVEVVFDDFPNTIYTCTPTLLEVI